MGATCAFFDSQSVPAYLLPASKNIDFVKACYYLNQFGFSTQHVIVPVADENSLRTELN